MSLRQRDFIGQWWVGRGQRPADKKQVRLGRSRPRELIGVIENNGEPSRARTCDPLIKSQLLYQLSYRPDEGENYTCANWSVKRAPLNARRVVLQSRVQESEKTAYQKAARSEDKAYQLDTRQT